MNNAYNATPILEKLPLQIEALTAYEDNLVVGTRQGHLLMYAVTETSQGRWDVSLLCSNKNFSRKPISQVQVVPEHQIIVSLSGEKTNGVISVHDLTVFNLPLLLTMPQTRGATAFDLDIKHQVSLTGETVATVRMAVAVKRRLQLYYWKARKFHNLREDIALPDSPRTITWCKEAIAIAYKHDYWLVQLTGVQKELISTGKSQDPLLLGVPEEGVLVLAHDKETVIMDSDGNAKFEHTLKWGETPVGMAYDKPFLISLLGKSVEVKTPEPNIDVQSIYMDKPKLVAVANSKKGVNPVYVASISHIWRLHRCQAVSHVNELVKQEKFSLALKLLEVLKEPKEVKEQMVLHVKHMQAFYFFQHKQFKDSMNLFLEVNRDSELAFVIGLFPKMVPEEFRFQINLPGRVPSLSSSETESAIQELIHFLLEMKRRYINRMIDVDEGSDCNITHVSSSSGSGKAATSLKEKIQVIDTTLLRCYIETNNNTLVESLVRMPETRVSLQEGERLLRKNEKFSELVYFYRSRGHHKRALQLLQRHSDNPESVLYGHDHTICYLQNLGPEYIDLIGEYSEWVLKSHPKDALRIFIGDRACSGEVESLPRQRVLSILRRHDQQLVMEYLEHVIWEWEDTNPIIHNELIMQYHRIITSPYASSDPVNIEQEKKKKEETRNRLMLFLNESKYFTPASLLAHFNSDLLHRERTVLLGRLGKHQQALTIYTMILGDIGKALEYCHKHYTPQGNGSEVYLILLKMIVTSSETPGSSPSKLKTQKIVETALNILQNYLHCIDLSQALKILPDEVKLQVLQPFIHTSLSYTGAICRKKQIFRGLTQSLKLQASKDVVACQSRKITLSEVTSCAVCRRRFTKHTAFALYPNGDIVHFSCQGQR
ncbi:vam6/Vps39-like protein isoform X3 [Palaemon carinicauda]|uniref:vam6/Vps39-like protein isoform X3 n=1 Tax=Palaemon carinicauda TaxID=392227 RepID=UPI0035B680A7